MHPLLRNAVIGIVALIVAGGLVALAVIGNDSGQSILAMFVAGVIGTLVGLFLFQQAWTWAGRAARRRETGPSILIAIGGGIMALVAAVSAAGLLILLLLFVLN